MTTLTIKEQSLLKEICFSEYNFYNGKAIPNGVDESLTWADVVLDSKSKGGVFTRLEKKGVS